MQQRQNPFRANKLCYADVTMTPRILTNPYKILFLPTLAVMFVDMGITFFGQGAGFWTNTFQVPNEASPVGFWVLQAHNPFIYIFLNLLYIAFAYLLFSYAKRPFNFMIAFGFLVGHFYGACTWIDFYVRNVFGTEGYYSTAATTWSWYATVAYAVIIGIITGFIWQKKIVES